MPGLPRWAISWVSSRTTRCPARGIRHSREALPSDVIDHVAHPEPPARNHLVMDEVQAPALVRQRQHRRRCPGPDSTLAAAPPPNRQTFLTIQPLSLLAVDHHALRAQPDMQAAVAEPASLVGHSAQLLAQGIVIIPNGTVAHALAIGIDDAARPPLAYPTARLEMSGSLPLRGGRHHLFDSKSFRATLSSIASASSCLSFTF